MSLYISLEYVPLTCDLVSHFMSFIHHYNLLLKQPRKIIIGSRITQV